MYHQTGSTTENPYRRLTTTSFGRAAWSTDAITERDRHDFEASLKAQAERVNRNSQVNRG